jgi:hypothetical protein
MPSLAKLTTGFVLIVSILAIVSPQARAQYPTKPPVEPTGPRGWNKLKDKGPGRDAVVTLGDGTLRGGWITAVGDANLTMQSAGKSTNIAAGDIATVRVKRGDKTLLCSVIGYVVTGTIATVMAYNNDDHNAYYQEHKKFQDLVVIFGVGGIPGGLIGAAVGHWLSGDVEIVP